MSIKHFLIGLAFSVVFQSTVMAASVTVTGSGSNFVINKIGGFDGVDGAQREAAFVAAAQVWADVLVSPVDIVVDAEFSSSLYCVSNSATLGSAGPLSTYFSAGAESFGLQNYVWYPTALINANYGADYFTGSADISATFNADLGDADCLNGSGWYYGMDGNTPSGMIDFYEVVLHELGHGLGILSLVNFDGSNNGGVIDIFTTFLKDQQTGVQWSAMNTSQRAASVVNSGNVVWTGAEVTALADQLTSGVNTGNVQMYAPTTYEGGSSISHFDTALTPNELMEPQYTGGASYNHSKALLNDIGWQLVANANAQPVITAQSSLSVDEDTSLTLSLNDLTVTDADNSYPADFSLSVNSGSNYSVAGLVITPNANFNGTLNVPVTVNDGTDNSAVFNLSVTVNAVNDKPVISAQNALSINEDSALTLNSSDLTISDPDDSSFTLQISGGSNYSVDGNQISPTANFHGTLTVPVTVSDGELTSDSFALSVTVNAVNDKPSISSTPIVSIAEDVSHRFVLADFGTSDAENDSLNLEILSGTNYSVANNDITPSANFNGTLTVSARVFDGGLYSDSVAFDVSVTAVNDAPQITAASNLSVDEDSAITLSVNDLTISDPDNSSFTLQVSNGSNYSVDGNQITPTANFYGTLTVPVTVSDGELTSDSFDLSVTVNGVNDEPSISSTPIVSIAEDASHRFVLADFGTSDAENDSLSLEVLSGANYSVANNEITPNVNFNGTLTVSARVFDGGLYSDSVAFNVNVTAVNDAPQITAAANISVDEDSSYNFSLADFTVSDVDGDDLSLTILPGNNFQLTANSLAPSADFFGTLTLEAQVSDGELTSDAFSFSVNVNAVDDAPLITGQVPLGTLEDEPLTLDLTDFTIVDVDSTNFSLLVLAGENYSVTGLTLTPTNGFNGQLTVPVQVNDGHNLSSSFNANITVTSVNSVPVISGLPTLSLFEDQSLNLSAADLSITDADSSEHSLTLLEGDNYQLIGNLITPDANFNGTLFVDLFVSDAFDDSPTETLAIEVVAVNDAPVFGPLAFSQASLEVEESFRLQLTATDIDSTDLHYSLSSNHDWLKLSPDGLLTGSAPANAIGGETVTLTVSDGELLDSLSFDLVVMDFDQADLSLSATLSENLRLTTEQSQLIIQLQNHGPAYHYAGTLTLEFDANLGLGNLPPNCQFITVGELGCMVSVDTAQNLIFDLSTSQEGVYAINARISGDKIDPIEQNNQQFNLLQFAENWTPPLRSIEIQNELATQNIAFADLNLDGKAEVISANGVFTEPTVEQLADAYDSTFDVSLLAGKQNARAVLAVDLNQDELLDLVFANDGANHVYFNQGEFVFAEPLTLGDTNSFDVLAIDVNQDSFVDLVFANEGANRLYLNNQIGGFVFTEEFGHAQSSAIDHIDINRDGFADLIVANVNDDDLIYLHRGVESGADFYSANPIIFTATLESHDLLVTDLDQDGQRDEVIVAQAVDNNNHNGISIYEISGSSLTAVQQLKVDSVISLDVADYDADGDVDIIALSSAGGINIFLQQAGSFEIASTFNVANAQSVTMQDINADNLADIAIAVAGVESSQLYISDNPFVPTTAVGFSPPNSTENQADASPSPTASEPLSSNEAMPEPEVEVVVVQSGSLSGIQLLLTVLLLANFFRKFRWSMPLNFSRVKHSESALTF